MNMAKTQVTSNKYCEDWVPVQGISNGMIILENNLKVTGVKITPRNIFILDADSQMGIINNLKKINQDKTIGIIICKKNNKYVIEYCSDNRIIAREYELV